MRTRHIPASVFALVVFLAVCAFLPLAAHAQASAPSELSSTIRAQLLSDPRTSTLSEAQLSAMVDLLSQEAQKQGLTAQDIEWHPNLPAGQWVDTTAVSEDMSCGGSYTCMMTEAFGFIGPDTTIPFFLGMSSMGLIWILAEMIHRHRYPHIVVQPAPSSGM